MHLDALKHLAGLARSLTECDRIVVFGSASLLATYPEVGGPDGPLVQTYDADLILMPFDEQAAKLVHEAIGRDRQFHSRFGYYADIIRPIATEQFPKGWDTRLVPLPDVAAVFCIEPHDMGAAKLQAGRPKDIELLSFLLKSGRLDDATLEMRLFSVDMQEALIARSFDNLKKVREKAREA